MPGFYEIKENESGQTSFVLKADNGEVILRSESYQTRASAENGIASVRSHCVKPENFTTHEAKDGSLYFNLMAANGLIIGTSQMYRSEASRSKGMESVKTNGPSTNVVTVS